MDRRKAVKEALNFLENIKRLRDDEIDELVLELTQADGRVLKIECSIKCRGQLMYLIKELDSEESA
jgi:hypothetical protein